MISYKVRIFLLVKEKVQELRRSVVTGSSTKSNGKSRRYWLLIILNTYLHGNKILKSNNDFRFKLATNVVNLNTLLNSRLKILYNKQIIFFLFIKFVFDRYLYLSEFLNFNGIVMIKKTINLLFLSMLLASTAFSQNFCGLTTEMQEMIVDQLRNNKEILRSQPVQYREVQYVPIQFHIVRQSDGKKGVSEQKIYDQLCELNEMYSGMDIVYYLKPFNYINNSTMYTDHQATTFFMRGNKNLNAMNIFVLQNANTSGASLGQTLAYFTPIDDWIVIRVDEVGGTKKTLSHEVGHFFSLAHTFRGWDGEAYEESVHGNPVGPNSPGGVPNEYQNGNNCQTAGDLICDTPPDYNFGFSWNGCSFTQQIMDPTGTVVDPMENNIMGYFLDCAPDEYEFTPMQEALALIDLSNTTYLHSDYVPSQQEIIGVATPLSPINSEVTPAYNTVELVWTEVEGANHYFLEISEVPSFNLNFNRYSTTVYGTSKWIDDFCVAGKSYWWRIRAVNEVNTCAAISSSGKFKAGSLTAVNNIIEISDWSVSPNPVSNASVLEVKIQAPVAFESEIKLFDLTGKMILQSGVENFSAGENIYALELNNQTSGVYILTIETAEGRLNKRVLILE